MHKFIFLLPTILLMSGVTSCNVPHKHPKVMEYAVAEIQGTSADSQIRGTVTFLEIKNDLKISAEIEGAPPGKHGFHIHEFGAVTNGGKDAGGHYNPVDTGHGMVIEDGKHHAHIGDLGNIEIGEDGSGSAERWLKGVSLAGSEFSVAGRAVIIHEKIDDFGQPTGNAGGRIAAGSILLVKQVISPKEKASEESEELEKK
ncbi:MAG: Cu-Zn family superoxide dismutase [Chlamydiales bacterium]|jgi:Cu-Zn family superoxide dismutase